MSFDKEQTMRYRGHLSLCEIDIPGQEAIGRGRVLIVGAGGLGSPVALYLAAAGVGTIGIVDPDRVSLSNLQRQIMHGSADVGRLKVESAREAMTRINPHVEVECHCEYLTAGNAGELISGYDLTIDCTDNLETRLLINDACVEMGKPLVFGSVSRFSGQLFTHLPGTADYRSIFDCTAPGNDVPCSINGVLNTVVGVIGALQATEALKYLAKAGDLLTDRILTFDAITMKFNEYRIAR